MARLPGADELFEGRHFDREIIVLCVRWYLRFKLSFRDLVEMMAERGLSMAHTTIMRWVHHYAPEFERRWQLPRRFPQVMADGIAVVALVRQHGSGIAVPLLHQPVISRHVMGLAFTEHDPDGETYGVATQMDLGAEPSARTTERLILLLGLFAGGAAMRPDDGAVDHLQHVQCATAVTQPEARGPRRRTRTRGG